MTVGQPSGVIPTPALLETPLVDVVGLLFIIYKATTKATSLSPEEGIQTYWLAPKEAIKLLKSSQSTPSTLIAEFMEETCEGL